ncbi:hypothetical protein [Saccharolobus caldissimus]|uniref:Uncharacterized protein n=1 Tax=Saccharolobus caldissimus TaxID=1702097 RepID=A0AAQ4CTI9_9CREN|nr:hypothetical protein [Saccharolobus caldissimus]BDB99120.1 hypothetical protein SACC_21370 [Saccharolobus caldissimus]
MELVNWSKTVPIKSLDYPEAYCIAVARDNNYIVLTENGGAYFSQRYLNNVKIWRAFEVLLELYKRGLINITEFETYQRETLHIFPKRDIEKLYNKGK